MATRKWRNEHRKINISVFLFASLFANEISLIICKLFTIDFLCGIFFLPVLFLFLSFFHSLSFFFSFFSFFIFLLLFLPTFFRIIPFSSTFWFNADCIGFSDLSAAKSKPAIFFFSSSKLNNCFYWFCLLFLIRWFFSFCFVLRIKLYSRLNKIEAGLQLFPANLLHFPVKFLAALMFLFSKWFDKVLSAPLNAYKLTIRVVLVKKMVKRQ